MTEVTLSPIVAGAWRMLEWQFSLDQRQAWIEGCLQRGVTTFDHADIYGGYQVESLFGEVLGQHPSLRDQMQLVSKCGIKLVSPQRPQHRFKSYDTSAQHITQSVEASLRALRTDHLDLLLIHRPDALMDADEVAQTFEQLRRDGKVRAFGASNFTPAQFELLHSRIPLVTNQIECSLLHLLPLHDGSLDQAQRLRLRPMIWSPLAGGRLFTANTEPAQRVRAVLQELAAGLAVNPTTVAMAWLLRHPCRPHPVFGSRRLSALDEALASLQLKLEREDWWRLWAASTGHSVP